MTNPIDDSARDIEPRDIEPRDIEPRDTEPRDTEHCDAAHAPAPSADDVAHGYAPPPEAGRTLVAVFASPVAGYLLRYGQDAGFRPVLVEPDPERARSAGGPGVTVVSSADGYLDGTADVVLTDHHRPELGVVLRDALASQARWVGIMGNPRHPAPHIPALTELGVPPSEIARVHRPIGLNIGSRTPAEIAIATLAGLIADRNERPGGLSF
jgi:xanthine dehydrogenase accessory factor